MNRRDLSSRLCYAAGFILLVVVCLAGVTATFPAKSPAQQGPPPNTGGRFVPGPTSGGGEELLDMEQWEAFWTNRLTYPTGRYDPAWLENATHADARIAHRVPAGTTTYKQGSGNSPLQLDPSRFTSLGPVGVVSYGDLWSGRVNAVAFDPVVTSTAYLAVNGGGIWKTTNCCGPATTFAPVTDAPNVPIIGVDDVVVDPHNHNVIYAGTGDLNFTIPQYPSYGILKSTDQGTSWSVLGADVFAPPYPQPPGTYPQDQAIGKVRIDPRDSRNVVAGTAKGLYFSYDTGQTWAGPCFTNNFGSQRQDTTGLLLRDNGTGTDIYTAVGTRAFSVTIHPVMAENGADGIYHALLPQSGCPAGWTLVSRPDNGWPAGTGSGIPKYQGGNSVGRIDLAFAPSTIAPGSTNVTIYAQAQSAYTLGQLGLWRSTDGGSTWERRSDVSALGGCGYDWPQNWFDQFVAVDPLDPNKVYMGTFDIWKSTDGGQSLTDLTCGYQGGSVHVDQHALAIAPGTTNVLLAGNDGGVYLSTDAGLSWLDLNGTMSTLEFYGGDITGHFATSAEPGAAGGTQDNGSMAHIWTGELGPAKWQGVLGGDGFWSRVEPVTNQRWYAEANGYGQRMLFVTDGGPNGFYQDISGSWRSIGGPILPYELYKYDCPATGCTHLIIGTNKVEESITGYGDWITVSPTWPGYIQQLSYSVTLSTTAVIGTSDGRVRYGFGLGKGQMGTWVDVTAGNAVLPNRPIMDVTTDPRNPLVAYAAAGGFDENTLATPGHLFRVACTAGCASFSWQNKTGNLPDMPVNSVIANPIYPQQLFVGTDWGVYFTDNVDATSPVWARFDAGLPHVMVWDMNVDAGFTTLAVWTRSRGAYVWPLASGPVGGTPTPTPHATLTPPTPTATASATVAPTVTATSTPCVINFSDVSPDDYFYDGVRYLYCRGVVTGYPDGTFLPYNNTTRGQLAKIIVLAESWPLVSPPTPTFVDVPAGHTFYAFVETAYAHGIVSGYPCGAGCLEYRPGSNVTRGQLAKIIVSAEAWPLLSPPSPTFRDLLPGDTFYNYVETAYSHGIISGYPCGAGCSDYRPGNFATRGQIAKIVYLAVTGP